MINLKKEKDKRDLFLLTTYELYLRNDGGKVSTIEVCNKLGLEFGSDGSKIGRDLRSEDLIDWENFTWITITPAGKKKAEGLMIKNYAEQEFKLFEKLMEVGVDKQISSEVLSEELNLPMDDLDILLHDFRSNGWIGMTFGNTVELYRDGAVHFHKSLQNTDGKRGSVIGQVFQTNNYGPSINQIGGNNNTQQVELTINPDLDDAIQSLRKIIESSSLPAHEMRLAIDDLVALQKLAVMEKSPGIVARALKILGSFEAIAKAANLATQIAPYVPQIAAHFQT